MNKKRIETFGEFCELIANEPENVYFDNYKTNMNISDSLDALKRSFNESDYYHIPPVKKKTLATYYHIETGEVKILEKCSGLSWRYKPNSEFEVDE